MELNELTEIVIGLCIKIHREVGPGLLESVYEECLCQELDKKNIQHTRQESIPVYYQNSKTLLGFRSDIIVDKKIIIEIKSVEKLQDVHKAQLLTYLRITNLKLGLLINFNVTLLKNGIKRIVNNL